jgi:hypothetical protein
MYHISDMTTLAHETDLRSRLLARIASSPNEVWTPGDFADLGSRAAVDKTLQRLATAGELRRIDRGLYDQPRKNDLTSRPTVPDYRAVIRAVTRRDQARELFVDSLRYRNRYGLMSEDIHLQTGELWGNFPQTYSMAGLVLTAMRLSRSWEDRYWRG